MTVLKLTLSEDDLNNLVNYLIEKLSFDYENHSTDMSILISEEYYFRSLSAQLNMIVIKKEDSYINIDVIGGAGGSGWFSIDWGSEKGYTRKIKGILDEYAKEHQKILRVTEN